MKFLALLAGTSLLVAAVAPAPAAAADPDRPWEHNNFAPASRTVTPKQVFRTTGTVLQPRPGAAVLTGAGSSITYDFGREVGGLVTLRFGTGGDPGQRLGLAFTESSQYVGTTSDASNGGSGADLSLHTDVTPGGTWTMPRASLRGGFRYLTLFAESAGSIHLNRVSLEISFTPSMTDLRDYANHFHSSDPLLNKIWYAGAYTVQTNTIAPDTGRVWGPPATGWDNSATVGAGSEILVDGAKRDRTVWPGDLGVSVPTAFASLGDLVPTRNALTTLYDHQTAAGQLPYAGPQVNFYGSDTYHLWSLIGTATYYQYTHDRPWLDTEWSGYRRAVDYILAQVGADGLLTVRGTADWARGNQGGRNIAANALLHQTLVTGAELATVRGDTALAATWTTTAVRLKAAVNDVLWDEAAGRYRDNPDSDLHPQDGNALAVWYGLAPADRAARVSAALTTNWNTFGATTPENGGQISTFPGSLEVQAHLFAGDATRALELIRREWGYMLNSPLGTGSTFWEGYLANGQFGYGGAYMSAAHGWATGPTSALTFYVLGIRPTTVDGGYVIHPEPGDLKSTEGSLRTPFGDIALAWRHDKPARTFTAEVDAPAGAVTRVDVPTFGARTNVTVNGRLAWDGRKGHAFGARLENGYVVLTGAPRRASVVSTAIGNVPETLAVAVTSAGTTPVIAGQQLSVPVTVSATGDRVVSGTVTATVPEGWTVAPAPFALDTRNGPGSTVVQVGVRPPADTRGGTASAAITATGAGTTASATVPLLVFGAWPAGTTATASSFHAPNVYNGQTRTYEPGNAVDATLATFWNDDTSGGYPDTLTVTAPQPVRFDGVGFASLVDGVPTDFTVQTWDGATWTTRATVTGNTALYRWIPFDPVSTSQVRVVVTASQSQNGAFSRIAEVTP
ncbi:discoidin domain-containing protein [Actinoplanes sp. NPDC051470]|uniref:alpha-L-rhamnosidase-related protein n=1 Tax=Actinoplanes sp. NPDC051470 TaxID=3157224 RepID=UPI0034320B06